MCQTLFPCIAGMEAGVVTTTWEVGIENNRANRKELTNLPGTLHYSECCNLRVVIQVCWNWRPRFNPLTVLKYKVNVK